MFTGARRAMWDLSDASIDVGGGTAALFGFVLTQQESDTAERLISFRHVRSIGSKLVVVSSPSTPAVDRCVDIFSRPDGTFGFEEPTRPRGHGRLDPIAYYSVREYETEADAIAAARAAVPWLPEVLDGQF